MPTEQELDGVEQRFWHPGPIPFLAVAVDVVDEAAGHREPVLFHQV